MQGLNSVTIINQNTCTMKNGIVKIGLLTLALCTFTLGNAQDKKQLKKDELFKTMDTNKDGVISTKEFEPNEARKELMKARMEEKLEERFKKLDKDGNGSVSFEEYKAMAEQRKKEGKKKRKMHKRDRK